MVDRIQKAGASAYIRKEEALEKLTNAIQKKEVDFKNKHSTKQYYK